MPESEWERPHSPSPPLIAPSVSMDPKGLQWSYPETWAPGFVHLHLVGCLNCDALLPVHIVILMYELGRRFRFCRQSPTAPWCRSRQQLSGVFSRSSKLGMLFSNRTGWEHAYFVCRCKGDHSETPYQSCSGRRCEHRTLAT